MNANAAGAESGQTGPPEELPLSTGFAPSSAKETPHADADAGTLIYQVVVYTGDVPDAGTDGDVWLWVDGTARRSGWLFLDNAENNFEQNQTDYFYFNLPDLGTPVSAWIYFRPLYDKPGWFLSTVTVNGRVFSHYDWLFTERMVRLRA